VADDKELLKELVVFITASIFIDKKLEEQPLFMYTWQRILSLFVTP
jgi:hypothetical protein